LADEHLAAGTRRADWSVGARPIDTQVGRFKQHHVTYLLRRKRINSGDFTAVGVFVGGKKRRKEERKREESEETTSTVVSRRCSRRVPVVAACTANVAVLPPAQSLRRVAIRFPGLGKQVDTTFLLLHS